MTEITLHAGDNRSSLRRLIDEGVRVHSVVTDPPYGLVSVQKRFGKDGCAPARTSGNDGSFARLSGGFMGKAWDATEIERDPEFWRLIHDILLPGGYCFAFSGSRTGHWQAVAMELAGFIIHPMHGWVYSSGFPKAHDAERTIARSECDLPGKHFMRQIPPDAPEDAHVCPATPNSEPWSGWAYGTQTQKPALEPIFLAQRPFSEKTGGENLLKHGVGAVNIEACRVPAIRPAATYSQPNMAGNAYNSERDSRRVAVVEENLGRHPANLLHDGSAEVVALFPDSKGQQGALKGGETGAGGDGANCYGKYGPRPTAPVRGDSGSAARFFNEFPLTWEDIPTNVPPMFYHRKANKADRDGSKHPTVKPIGLLQHLIRHITPPGGVVLDPFAGSGTTAEAARREGFDCILMEQESEYVTFLRHRFDLPQPQLSSEVLAMLA